MSATQLWSQYQTLIKTDSALVSALGDSPWGNHDGKQGRADEVPLCLQKRPARELSDEANGCERLVAQAVGYVNRTGRDLDFLKAVLGYLVHNSQFYLDDSLYGFVAHTANLLKQANP